MLIILRNKIIPRFFRDLKKSEKGTILIEFAFVFPVSIMLLLGGFETFRLLMAHRKTNATAMSVGNLVSQNKAITTSSMQNIFDAVDNVMKPLKLNQDGQIIISYVTGTSSGNTIALQCKGTANTLIASKIGTQGNTADLTKLPGSFSLADAETVVVSEVTYHYEPVFINMSSWINISMFTAHDVYHVSVQKPRYDSITFSGCP